MTTLAELIAEHCNGMTDYEAIAALLTASSVMENPRKGETDTITHTTVTPITLKDVLAIVPTAERLKIRKQLPGFIDDVRRAIDTADADYMTVLLTDAATDGSISAETAAELTELLQSDRTVTTETEYVQPDTIPGPSIATEAGFERITSADVQAAMNL